MADGRALSPSGGKQRCSGAGAPDTTLRPKPCPFWTHRCIGEAGQSGGQRAEVGVGGRGC